MKIALWGFGAIILCSLVLARPHLSSAAQVSSPLNREMLTLSSYLRTEVSTYAAVKCTVGKIYNKKKKKCVADPAVKLGKIVYSTSCSISGCHDLDSVKRFKKLKMGALTSARSSVPEMQDMILATVDAKNLIKYFATVK